MKPRPHFSGGFSAYLQKILHDHGRAPRVAPVEDTLLAFPQGVAVAGKPCTALGRPSALATAASQAAVMVARLSQWSNELIEYQRGVVARWQLADQPGDLSAIDSLIRGRRWQTLYRGVYAAYTGPPAREGTLWAAALRCGPLAALSHFTAAELDGLADRPADAIHVTIPRHVRVVLSETEFGDGHPRIVVHRSARCDAAKHPARTPSRIRTEETVLDLVDLAATFDLAFGWMSTACGRRLVTVSQLSSAAAGRAKLRWRNDVAVALEEISDGVMSNLERGYLRLVERPHRLPKPHRQAKRRQGRRSSYLDNLYQEFGLVVELDGLGAHPAESRWRDIHRDNFFAGSGIVTLRYSWADIVERPCQVACEIARVLRLRGWTGTVRSCGPRCHVTSS
jgi:very-short-patch-repair endonuclease